MKTLTFEGAGWEKAEHNGVGNCRIRTTFINNDGEEIYLEISGFQRPVRCIDAQKNFDFPWTINHCFKTKDEKYEYTPELKQYEYKYIQEYTQENILNFVNKELNCSFESIKINNRM